jgi:hypothetical protein
MISFLFKQIKLIIYNLNKIIIHKNEFITISR